MVLDLSKLTLVRGFVNFVLRLLLLLERTG